MVYYIHCSSFICIITHFHTEGNHICQSWFALNKSIWLLLITFLTFMGLHMDCNRMCKSWVTHTAKGSVQWPHQGFSWGWLSYCSFSLPSITFQRRKQESLSPVKRKISQSTGISTDNNSTIIFANCCITLYCEFLLDLWIWIYPAALSPHPVAPLQTAHFPLQTRSSPTTAFIQLLRLLPFTLQCQGETSTIPDCLRPEL